MCKWKAGKTKTKTKEMTAVTPDQVAEGILDVHRFLFEFLPQQPRWLKGSGAGILLSTVGLLLVYHPQDVALNIQYPLAVAILLYFGLSFREFERSGGTQPAAASWWRQYPGPLLLMYGSFLYGWINFFLH